MERLFTSLPTWLLVLISSSFLASSQLQIPLEVEETNVQLDNDIKSFFRSVNRVNNIVGCYNYIAYTGNIHLNPSLEQRLMEHLKVPIYSVVSNKGSVNHPYKKSDNMVMTLFSGLDDSTLSVFNDTEVYNGKNFYSFLYVPGDKNKQLFTKEDMWKFFSWCFKLNIDRVLLHFRGESEFEAWTYLYVKNITLTRLSKETNVENMLRSLDYRFTVQVANDLPAIFWYNSTEQADVIGGGKISLNGPIGILMVEFMRYINASMDILLTEQKQNSNFGILQAPIDPRVDMVANLVINDSLVFGPVVMDTKICLLVPRRRKIPQSKYFNRVLGPRINLITLPTLLVVFVIKYIAQRRRRSLVDSFFSTFRFYLGLPLPAGHLDRLPLADKIIEVYSFLFMAIFISAGASLLSSAFTAGLYYPPITDVESMRASGLRIITEHPTIKQAFKENIMPSALADLVDLVDNHTVFKNMHNLNDSVVNVALTTHWMGLRLYQERLKIKRLEIAGPKLCSNTRQLRLPISPRSPLRFTFIQYFHRVFESGLQQKWLRMSFQKFRQVYNITKLPIDRDNEWQPLTLSFYQGFIIFYMCGMLLSTIVFVVELLYKRYIG